MYGFQNTAAAIATIMQAKQSTDDSTVQDACEAALTAFGENSLVLPDDVDPNASIKDVPIKYIQAGIDELNNTARARNDGNVSDACDAIVDSFLGVIAAINAL